MVTGRYDSNTHVFLVCRDLDGFPDLDHIRGARVYLNKRRAVEYCLLRNVDEGYQLNGYLEMVQSGEYRPRDLDDMIDMFANAGCEFLVHPLLKAISRSDHINSL